MQPALSPSAFHVGNGHLANRHRGSKYRMKREWIFLGVSLVWLVVAGGTCCLAIINSPNQPIQSRHLVKGRGKIGLTYPNFEPKACLFPHNPHLVGILMARRRMALSSSLLLSSSNDEEKDELVEEIWDMEDIEIYGGRFLNRVGELQTYKLNHGDCLVPKRYQPNPTLGNWVNKQRQEYRRYQLGMKSSMTPDRIRLLNQLGFVWVADSVGATRARNEKIWRNKFEQLRQYRQEHGHCRIPSSSSEYTNLKDWILKQRLDYKRLIRGEQPTSMTKERIDLLESIDFVWISSSTQESRWARRFEELKQYKEEHGDTLVPINYKENLPLAQWVSVQRKNYNLMQRGEGSRGLTDDRIAKLEAIGFVWNYWENQFMSLLSTEENDDTF